MTTTTKSNRRQELESSIKDTHDMQKEGQVYSWEACGVTGVEKCSICGLAHHWGANGQNTGSFSRWEDARGEAITLAEAAARDCA